MTTRKLSTYLAQSDAEDQRPKRSPLQCIANGCPLPGSFRLRNDTSICRAHDDAPAHKWDAITARIISRESAFAAADRLLNARAQSEDDMKFEPSFIRVFGDEAKQRKKFYGFPEQIPSPRGLEHETARDYGARMMHLLVREARAEPTEIPPEAARLFDDIRSTVAHHRGESHDAD